MSILIIFRKTAVVNKFHKLIIDTILTGEADEAIICSGFFQEDLNFSSSLSTQLANSIYSKNIKLQTIGIHNGSWKLRYVKFRDNFRNLGVNIVAFVAQNYHWHAKIFILKKNGEPIFGIIGSSNMTRPAFDYSSPFNFEADVVLWNYNNQKIDKICQSQTDLIEGENANSFIYADYNFERNGNITPMEKLKEIEKELFSSNLNLLP